MEPNVFSMKVPYVKASGQSAEVNVPLVDIPSGTLLFRGIKLPDIEKGEDPRLFVRDFLGQPQGDHFCLSPIHNVFFYPFPHVPFGAHTVGSTFNAMMIYQTTRNLRIACMINPSKWIRGGDIKRLDGTAPIQRCNKFSYSCREGMTPEEIAKEDEVKSWDNCIRPEWAVSSGVSGWMAIADYDSLDNFDVRGTQPKDTSMGSYLRELEARLPGVATTLLADMYSDNRRHRGIPEIALYPWSPHPGPENQLTDARDENEAAEAITELSESFNFLPVACITTNGILEAFSGDFKSSDLPTGSSQVTGATARTAIDMLTHNYMNSLMTRGVQIPELGTAHVVFDTRTGFYVMDLFKPNDISFQKNGEGILYEDLLMPLATEDDKKRMLEYKILFRSFFQAKALNKETLSDGRQVRRAFIFERPPILRTMFTDLQFAMPPKIARFMRSAAALFQINRQGGGSSSKKNKTRKAQKGGDHVKEIADIEPISEKTEGMMKEYLSSTYRDLWASWIQRKSSNSS